MADVELEYDFDPNALLEIYVNNKWIKVDAWAFRSWCGNRRINGNIHKGKVYLLGRNINREEWEILNRKE